MSDYVDAILNVPGSRGKLNEFFQAIIEDGQVRDSVLAEVGQSPPTPGAVSATSLVSDTIASGSWSKTVDVPAGQDQILFVLFSSDFFVNATAGGSSMSLVLDNSDTTYGKQKQRLFCMLNPAPGSITVVGTPQQPTHVRGHIFVVSGVAQEIPSVTDAKQSAAFPAPDCQVSTPEDSWALLSVMVPFVGQNFSGVDPAFTLIADADPLEKYKTTVAFLDDAGTSGAKTVSFPAGPGSTGAELHYGVVALRPA